jgi:exopolysaccharide biosynthesis polyprenyl glycosylphosphotransferase
MSSYMAIRRYKNILTQMKVLTVILDALALAALTHCVFYLRVPQTPLQSLTVSNGFWFFFAAVMFFIYLFGGFDLQRRYRKVFVSTFSAVVFAAIVMTIANFLLYKDRSGIFGRGVLLGSSLLFLVYAQALRWAFGKWYTKFREQIEWVMWIHKDYVDDVQADVKYKGLEGFFTWVVIDEALLQEQFKKICEQSDNLVVALKPGQLSEDLSQTLLDLRLSGKSFLDLTEFYERFLDCLPVFYLNPQSLIFSSGFSILERPLLMNLKRVSDVVLSLAVLLLTSPFLILTALGVRISSSGPIFFAQTRTGKNGKPFLLYKFRSMVQNAEAHGPQWAQKNDQRVTVFGKFIRKVRLDELPQIWNILKGDMSFIGPRPERPEFDQLLKKQIPYYDLKYLVRPGLTGWAQVEFPYGASVEDSKKKLQFEIFYIKNYSFYFEFLILLKTIRVVFLGRGR